MNYRQEKRMLLPQGFQNKFMYLLIHGIMRGLGLLPTPVRTGLADAVSRLWYRLDKRHRMLAQKNLSINFPEKSQQEIRRVVKAVFQHWSRMFFEIGWGMRLDARNVEQHVRFEGLDNLSTALRKKKGALLITGHIGTWEIMPACFEKMRFPMSAVYRVMDYKPLDSFFVHVRTRLGSGVIPVSNAMTKIEKALLDENQVVAMLIDQNANTRNGVFINFMGRQSCASQGMARLALSTGSPALPGFIIREPGSKDQYRMILLPEIPLIRTGNYEEDIRINTERFNKAIESMIRRYPEQWLWVHDRWKTRK